MKVQMTFLKHDSTQKNHSHWQLRVSEHGGRGGGFPTDARLAELFHIHVDVGGELKILRRGPDHCVVSTPVGVSARKVRGFIKAVEKETTYFRGKFYTRKRRRD